MSLRSAESGAPLPELYAELRQAARRLLRRDRSDALFQTTAVLHEAYLRVVRRNGGPISRTRFLAAAVGEMRRVLIDQARRRKSQKRGGGWSRVTIDACALEVMQPTVDWCDLHDALEQLARLSPRQARVVELRFLAGLEEEETADVLGVSRRTVQQDWRGARAWLRRELGSRGEEIGGAAPADSHRSATRNGGP